MFYYAAKITWFIMQPLGLLLILLLFTLWAALRESKAAAMAWASVSVLLLVLLSWSNLSVLILQPLESRFPAPDEIPGHSAGIIVLGGGTAGQVNRVRGGYELNDSGDRLVNAAILARRFPDLPILISGGGHAIIGDHEAEAQTGKRLLTALGIDQARIITEDRSRNTAENARFSRELVNPEPGAPWLLITSAFHMPRSVALFRKAGFDVIPWPVDYRTTGRETFGFNTKSPSRALLEASTALREWTGLMAYWATGRIDSPFPAP